MKVKINTTTKNIFQDNLQKLFLVLISELFCLVITRVFFIKYNNPIYFYSMNILQILYFLPLLIVTPIILFHSKSDKHLICSTILLIIYSIVLYVWLLPIASFFTNTQGIINFLEYAFKIYFIGLPLIGLSTYKIKKESIIKTNFLTLSKIILFILITLLFDIWFGLKGILYAMPISQLFFFLIIGKEPIEK